MNEKDEKKNQANEQEKKMGTKSIEKMMKPGERERSNEREMK